MSGLIVRDDGPAGRRHPAASLLHEPLGDVPGVARGVDFAKGLSERLAAFDARA
jgi:hypothetical protein